MDLESWLLLWHLLKCLIRVWFNFCLWNGFHWFLVVLRTLMWNQLPKVYIYSIVFCLDLFYLCSVISWIWTVSLYLLIWFLDVRCEVTVGVSSAMLARWSFSLLFFFSLLPSFPSYWDVLLLVENLRSANDHGFWYFVTKIRNWHFPFFFLLSHTLY